MLTAAWVGPDYLVVVQLILTSAVMRLEFDMTPIIGLSSSTLEVIPHFLYAIFVLFPQNDPESLV